MVTTVRTPSPDAVVDALRGVADPEIPNVSVVELGMIGAVRIEEGSVEVELLPTFVGCPALELIRESVATRVNEAFGLPVGVAVSYATPWTSDRITPEGRAKLAASGFAPPPHLRAASGRSLPVLAGPLTQTEAARGPAIEEATPCPFCGSTRTRLENAFGPTQCRAIWHCAECRQPFEAFKPV